MRTFSATGRDRVRKPVSAWTCALVNQLATPGLGSLMGGRILAGTLQLVLAVLGFACFVGWFAQACVRTYRMTEDLPPVPARYPWLGWAGLGIFGAAWLLAWVTSLSLLREARRNRESALTVPANQPPKIRP
jgi:hypothetical protein